MVWTDLILIALLVPLPWVVVLMERRHHTRYLEERDRARRLAMALQDVLARETAETRSVALDELWRYWEQDFRV